MQNVDISELEDLGNLITRVVDFERSRLEERVVIKYGIDARLDSLRSIYSQLPDRLSSVASEIAEKLNSMRTTLKSINVVYFPQLGYLTASPILHQYELLGLFPEWQVIFTTDKIAYFKNDWTRNLDDELGDVHADIVDCEIEIYEGIKEEIRRLKDTMEELYDLVCLVDCMTGLSSATIKLGLEKAHFIADRFELINSRHLILEQCTSLPFIPNDILLTKERPITIITGPNSSGKSVLMKQIGLNCILNQMIGYSASSQASKTPIIKELFTRIKTVESAASRSSSFAIELEQIRQAIENCTENTLLLIDEFGKGTKSEDGISLLAALVDYIAGNNPPWVVLVTHFPEIFDCLSSDTLSKINWLQMDIYYPDNQATANPTFLFKSVPGLSASSLGIHCAKAAGICNSVLEEATDIQNKLRAGIPARDLAWCLVTEEQETSMALLIKEHFSN